jgi:hypothetical protein
MGGIDRLQSSIAFDRSFIGCYANVSLNDVHLIDGRWCSNTSVIKKLQQNDDATSRMFNTIVVNEGETTTLHQHDIDNHDDIVFVIIDQPRHGKLTLDNEVCIIQWFR